MLILAKAVMAVMLGFVSTVIFGYFVVKYLKKKGLDQNVSKTLEETRNPNHGWYYVYCTDCFDYDYFKTHGQY